MSANTVARRVENIAENISSQLFDKNGHVEWFSLALDESTDVHTTETEFPIDFAIETFCALKINFDTRFWDFDAIANQIKIFQNPFDTDIEILAPELQMEMIDLQCSDIIKNKYQNSSLLEFYKSLPLTLFDNLHKFARGLFPVFGTTYLCEKTFSKMKYTKNVYRSKLADEHLKSLLIIGTSKISPQLQTIVSGKSQLHKSH
ncbi:proteinral transcription factor ii-i repeat domain-containing protein 2a [Trichonephila clavata]|uniref:Proteinral transcription factor ii-i repeat domain-containing protein 2a n=1 Tax=Trichonephila clavata TaxID=2740835 RepID=A0A8X6HCD5_TRICU|nr:proteinral transcription factor ii-i repeat domain-containing protein 2a [Trichonephila clavata]